MTSDRQAYRYVDLPIRSLIGMDPAGGTTTFLHGYTSAFGLFRSGGA